MFQHSERELSEKEKRLLSRELSRVRTRHSKGWRDSLGCGFIIAAVISFLVWLSKETPNYVVGLLFVAVFMISVWAWFSARKELKGEMRKIEAAYNRNRASVVTIQSEQVVDFEEIEDEGADYAFQVTDDSIVFVCGQDFYPSAKFPNSDFDIVEILSEENESVGGGIEKRGQKLKPIRTIPANAKKGLAIPGHLEIVRGRLENLEQLLRSA